MEAIHTDISINMENYYIMVLILLILEDIVPMLTCPALEQMEYHTCTGKSQVEVAVSIMEVLLVLIVVYVVTIITTTGFRR